VANVTAITVRTSEGVTKTFHGRAAWALANLIGASDQGCTPINHPGPRWSHYTWLLRRAGIMVETITEGHGGAYAGHHARYVLRSAVEVVAVQEAGA
jgi:hypothetical protein